MYRDNDFDDILKQKLDSFEASPKRDIWTELEHSIYVSNKSFWGTAGILTCAVVFMGAYYLSNFNTTTEVIDSYNYAALLDDTKDNLHYSASTVLPIISKEDDLKSNHTSINNRNLYAAVSDTYFIADHYKRQSLIDISNDAEDQSYGVKENHENRQMKGRELASLQNIPFLISKKIFQNKNSIDLHSNLTELPLATEKLTKRSGLVASVSTKIGYSNFTSLSLQDEDGNSITSRKDNIRALGFGTQYQFKNGLGVGLEFFNNASVNQKYVYNTLDHNYAGQMKLNYTKIPVYISYRTELGTKYDVRSTYLFGQVGVQYSFLKSAELFLNGPSIKAIDLLKKHEFGVLATIGIQKYLTDNYMISLAGFYNHNRPFNSFEEIDRNKRLGRKSYGLEAKLAFRFGH